jgi:heme exporter protein D
VFFVFFCVARYDAAWVWRSVVLALIVIAVVVIVYPLYQARRRSAHA